MEIVKITEILRIQECDVILEKPNINQQDSQDFTAGKGSRFCRLKPAVLLFCLSTSQICSFLHSVATFVIINEPVFVKKCAPLYLYPLPDTPS